MRHTPGASDKARELLSCLVGVAHAEVTPDGRGGILGVRVWGTGEFSPDRTVRSVQSALRAHLDLYLPPERIRFIGDPVPPDMGNGTVIVTEAPTDITADDETAAAGNGAGTGPTARILSRPEPRPEGEQAEEPSLLRESPVAEAPRNMPPPPAPASTATGPSEDEEVVKAPDAEGPDRILYEGFDISNHRSRQAQLKVKLDWRGGQFMGLARSSGDPEEQAEALARATLKALEGIVHTTVKDATFSLELAGIRFVEVLPYQLVVVVVKLKLGREVLPLSGSVVARHGQSLAAVLAVLQASDRRVRAILEHVERTPEREPEPQDGDELGF